LDNIEMEVYICDEGPGDTTVRPADPAVQKMMDADRKNIELMVAWAKREQEKIYARQHAQRQPDKP
jgi:hypothetical protein